MVHSKVLLIKCRLCEKEFNYYEQVSRPFCSEKCRLIDLGAWLNESYAIPEKSVEFKEDEDEAE